MDTKTLIQEIKNQDTEANKKIQQILSKYSLGMTDIYHYRKYIVVAYRDEKNVMIPIVDLEEFIKAITEIKEKVLNM